MGHRARLIGLVAVFVTVALGLTGVHVWTLARYSIDDTYAWLELAAESRAATVGSVARFDEEYSTQYPGGALAATIAQFEGAEHGSRFGESGEFVLAREVNGDIHFLLPSMIVPSDSTRLGEPMRLALRGQTGTIRATDYDGTTVMAAFRPVPEIDGAVVVKIDEAEVLGDLWATGVIHLGIGVLIALIGGGLFFRLGDPVVRDLALHSRRRERLLRGHARAISLLDGMVKATENAVWVRDEAGRVVLSNPKARSLYGFPEVSIADFESHQGSNYGSGPAEELVVEQEAHAVLAAGATEHVHRHTHNGRILRSVVSPVLCSGEEDYRLGLSVDVTAEVQRGNELQAALTELELTTRTTMAFVTASDDEELLHELLQVFLEASKSSIGAIGIIDESGALAVPSDTPDGAGDRHDGHGWIVSQRDEWDDALWQRATRSARILIDEDGSGRLPDGTDSMRYRIAAPIIDRGTVIGVVDLTKERVGYDVDDRELIRRLTRHIAPMLGAHLLRERSERARIDAEDRLREFSDQLTRSNKDLEQFAYIASHDLQEPLRMVASFTQLLADRYRGQLDSDADEFINYAVEGATRMQSMINGLLQYSRAGRAEIATAPVDTEAVVRRVLDNLVAAIGESGAEAEVGPLPPTLSDDRQLERVLQNLVHNAIRYAGDAPPRIRITGEEADGVVTLHVQDQGIGMDPGQVESAFQLFRRLTPRGPDSGSGLGLAIARRIVERMGGRIWADTRPGEGSTFHITLPAPVPALEEA